MESTPLMNLAGIFRPYHDLALFAGDCLKTLKARTAKFHTTGVHRPILLEKVHSNISISLEMVVTLVDKKFFLFSGILFDIFYVSSYIIF